MTTAQTQTDNLEKLRDMIKEIDFCMVTTIDQNGTNAKNKDGKNAPRN